MKARVLPMEEWERLKDTGEAHLWPWVPPQNVEVIVVEEGDKIIATWTLMRVAHVEALWCHPDYRGNAGAARRLMRLTGMEALRWGETKLMTGAINDHVRDLIARVGGKKVEMDTYILPVGRA